MTTWGLAMTAGRIPVRATLAVPMAFVGVFGLAFALTQSHGAIAVALPVSDGSSAPSLGVGMVATVLRMIASLLASLAFAIVCAGLATGNRVAGRIVAPVLDVLRCVPVPGFAVFALALSGRLLPAADAADAAIAIMVFAAQAWPMARALTDAMRAAPADLDEVSRSFGLTSWQRFWRLSMPAGVPALVHGAMRSMTGGWFMLLAGEALASGYAVVPGVGVYAMQASARRDGLALLGAIIVMAAIVVAFDMLVFAPLAAWSDRFRPGSSEGANRPDPVVLTAWRRTRRLRQAGERLGDALTMIGTWRLGSAPRIIRRVPADGAMTRRYGRSRLSAVLLAIMCAAVPVVWRFEGGGAMVAGLTPSARLLADAAITLLRVAAMIALSCAIWIPAGVGLGLRPGLVRRAQPLARFLARYPVNLLYPLLIGAAATLDADTATWAGLWVVGLMMLGAQCCILIEVMDGAAAFPAPLLEAARKFDVRGRLWWRAVMLPGLAPQILAGLSASAAMAWNIVIIAESSIWGRTGLPVRGIGADIAHDIATRRFAHATLAVAIMTAIGLLAHACILQPLRTTIARRLPSRDVPRSPV